MLQISITPTDNCYRTQLWDSWEFQVVVSVPKWRQMMDPDIEQYRDMCKELLDWKNRLIELPRQ